MILHLKTELGLTKKEPWICGRMTVRIRRNRGAGEGSLVGGCIEFDVHAGGREPGGTPGQCSGGGERGGWEFTTLGVKTQPPRSNKLLAENISFPPPSFQKLWRSGVEKKTGDGHFAARMPPPTPPTVVLTSVGWHVRSDNFGWTGSPVSVPLRNVHDYAHSNFCPTGGGILRMIREIKK